MEEILETRNCRNCGGTFPITDRDMSFYQKIGVPAPTWCPPCRELRRMAWCNESVFYPNKCQMCDKGLISQFPADQPRPIVCIDCWWGDRWDPTAYGREVDFSRSLFEQFHELELAVPHACVATDIGNENSEYTHHAGQERNCYFIFHATFCEDCYYGYGVKKAKDCVDVHNCFESELCYECVDVDKCYGLCWSQDCFNCATSYFIRDCVGCTDCFLCVGLRNKQYCFLNRQLSKQEYLATVRKIDTGSYEEVQRLRNRFLELQKEHLWKHLRHTMTEHSTGDYLINTRNARFCFDCRDVEESRFCSQLQLGSRHCYDIYQFGVNMELCYEGAMIGTNAYNVHFGSLCIWQVSDLQYCMECYTTSNCFLCFGLKKKQYCILNKQYSEDDYYQLKARIVEKMKNDGEYGEFFPLQFSQFGYNETTAARWFPLTREQVLEKGWRWREDLPGTYGRETVSEIPDSIVQAGDDITKETLVCQSCCRNYKIISQELDFYRKNSLALPRECFECRRARRMKQRNPRQLWQRNCFSCEKPIETSFSPERPEQVVCEKCYHKQIL